MWYKLKRIMIRPNGVEKQVRPITPITTPWIYHNATLWLISMSSDGSTRYTIADKNLWATSTDITSTDSYGNYYQWWNNYWFVYWWTPTTSSSTVDASTYWPWNYYSSSTFRRVARWDSSNNTNLRWETTNTNVARRWPCPEWYHIPSAADSAIIVNIFWGLTASDFSQYFKIPLAWIMKWSDWTYTDIWTRGCIWTSYAEVGEYWIGASLIDITSSVYSTSFVTSFALSIRPFKNEAVQPDSSRTVLYQPS